MFKPQHANTNAWDIPERAINLPSYQDLVIHEQNRIIDAILSIRKIELAMVEKL